MKLVLAEATTAAQLVQLGLRPTVVSALLTTAPPLPVRIDARSLESATLWLSDLGAPEGGFKTWPSELSSALKKGLRGARQFTRHNLFTAIFAFDPATVHGARTAGYVATILKRNAPLRIGVLARSADGSGDSNLATRALGHLHAVGGRAALIAFLRTLGARAEAAVGAPRRAPVQAAASVDVHNLFTAEEGNDVAEAISSEIAISEIATSEEGDAAGAAESDALSAANTDGAAQAEAGSAQDGAAQAEAGSAQDEATTVAEGDARASTVDEPTIPQQVLDCMLIASLMSSS